MTNLTKLKKFVFDGILLEDSFQRLEEDGISVRSNKDITTIQRVEDADFSPKIIHNANKMASIFILFFCLENAVRDLITERLSERHGPEWWDNCVSKKIKDNVEKLKEKEDKDRYHSRRSASLIGYTMFGNLSQIILNSWDDFEDLFPDQSWVSARFTDLEKSRNIIMHTGILPEIEIERIESIARDWVRQVG